MPKSVLLGVYPTKGERVALIPVEAALPQRVECQQNQTFPDYPLQKAVLLKEY